MIAPVIPAGKKLFLQSVSMQTALTHGQSPYNVTVAIFQGLGRNPLGSLYVDMDLQASAQQETSRPGTSRGTGTSTWW